MSTPEEIIAYVAGRLAGIALDDLSKAERQIAQMLQVHDYLCVTDGVLELTLQSSLLVKSNYSK